MPTKTIQIAEADTKTLTKYATEVLGLPIKPRTPLPALRAKVSTALNGASSFLIRTGGDAPAPLPEQAQPTAPSVLKGAYNKGKPDALKIEDEDHPETVEIEIHAQDKPGGRDPVPVAVNGRAMLIPRGKKVPIPWAYFEVLSKAVETHYDPIQGGGLSEPRYVPRYPFNRTA